MAKESGPKNKVETYDQGASSYSEVMQDAVAFDAAEARKRAEKFKRQKEEQERVEQAAKEEERLKREAEREARKAEQLAKAEEERRKHQEAWEARREEHDYSPEILDAFMSHISDSIAEASEKGEESVNFVKEVNIDYGPYGDYTRQGTVSTLTGREIGRKNVEISSVIDGVIENDPSNDEFDSEIRDIGNEVMPQIKDKLEEAGYAVAADSRGLITSVSWGEAAKPEPNKQGSMPNKQGSMLSKLFSRFKKKD